MPDFLDEVGRKAWVKIVTDLETLGILDKTDSHIISLYATNYSLFRRAKEELDSVKSMVITASNGRVSSHPLLATLNSYANLLKQLLIALQLVPRLRTKVDEEYTASKDSWAGLV